MRVWLVVEIFSLTVIKVNYCECGLFLLCMVTIEKLNVLTVCGVVKLTYQDVHWFASKTINGTKI